MSYAAHSGRWLCPQTTVNAAAAAFRASDAGWGSLFPALSLFVSGRV